MTGTCVSLWIGPALSAVERACIRSVLRQEHRFVLYRYDDIDGVPDGVENRDAAEIVPAGRIIRHKGGSVALFANLFRYELQRQGLGTRLDLDLYMLKPLDMNAPYLLGEEEPGRYTNGALRLPPDCPMLPALLALFEERTVPAWLPWRARVAAHWRLWRTGRAGLSQMPWGSAGPAALTHLVHAHGLAERALPPRSCIRCTGAMPAGSSIPAARWKSASPGERSHSISTMSSSRASRIGPRRPAASSHVSRAKALRDRASARWNYRIGLPPVTAIVAPET